MAIKFIILLLIYWIKIIINLQIKWFFNQNKNHLNRVYYNYAHNLDIHLMLAYFNSIFIELLRTQNLSNSNEIETTFIMQQAK